MRLTQVPVSVLNCHLIIIASFVVVVVVFDVIRICNGIIVFSEEVIAAITKAVLCYCASARKAFKHTRSSIYFAAPSLAVYLSRWIYCTCMCVCACVCVI